MSATGKKNPLQTSPKCSTDVVVNFVEDFFYRAQMCTKLRKFQRFFSSKKMSKNSSPIFEKIVTSNRKIHQLFRVPLTLWTDTRNQRPRHKPHTISENPCLKLQFSGGSDLTIVEMISHCYFMWRLQRQPKLQCPAAGA